tara:strand:+ start:312 stop:671 length:360 start_codon:yes stop_codon:yes gene_type:complete
MVNEEEKKLWIEGFKKMECLTDQERDARFASEKDTPRILKKLETDQDFESAIIEIAKLHRKFCSDIKMSELIKGGEIGFEKAKKKFDHKRGYKFTEYSYWWIRQGMTKVIDDFYGLNNN